jgi:Leucine-rich repeat (LRR) protein
MQPDTISPADAREEDDDQQQQQEAQLQPTATYAACLTPEAKAKGDAGIYAAMDAMQLSRALHGATASRLDLPLHPTVGAAAGGGVAGARANGAGGLGSNNSGSGGGGSNMVQLGMEPEVFRHGVGAAVQAIVSDAVVGATQSAAGDAPLTAGATKAAVQRGMEGGLCGTSATAVGVPDDVNALAQVLPLVQELKPRDVLNYDALQRLFALMEAATVAASVESPEAGVTTLLLSKGVVDPAKQPAPPSASWEAKYKELQSRYPLPSTKGREVNVDDDDDAAGSGDEEGEAESEGDGQHNVALQERCAALHIPYSTYKQALRDVASYEMRVFPLLCAYLSHNEACRERGGAVVSVPQQDGERRSAHSAACHRACANVKVLNIAGNRLGAPAVPGDHDGDNGSAGGGVPVRQLAPLRALAAMIDANESLRYLNLRDNALGPRGVGIVAKALTKNIALTGIDLSANLLNGAAVPGVEGDVEEVEDPLYEEEDPVFGETLEGLDALAEVLKKNKFLRVLRLGDNGLHSGEDLTGPPPPEEEAEEVELEEEVASNDGASVVDSSSISGGDVRAGKAPAARKGLSMAEAQEKWQGVPLWNLLTPLHRYHRLRVLDLSKNFLGNTGAQMVAVAVAHNHSIEVLDLTDNAIGYSGLSYLAQYLLVGPPSPPPSHGCALHTLILRQNPLSCAGGAADAATGIDARRRRLTKRQQKQAAAAVASFAAGLRRHGRLRRLILANAYLGPAASAVVLRALAHVPTLEELDFSFNNACGEHSATFDPTAIPHMAALLFPASSPSHPASVLQRLCLDGNNLTSAGLAALQPAEPGTPLWPALRELTLSRNSLGDALEPIAALLASGLTRLDLSYNDISTMATLIHGVPLDCALEDLNVSHNKLGVQEGLLRDVPAAHQEAEVSEFFHCLAQLPNLAVVDLSYNDWRPAHIEQLRAFFADPGLAVGVRKLDVRHTPRVPAGPLMNLLQTVATRPAMEVFFASVPVAMADEEGVMTHTGEGVWTFETAVAAIHAVVCASDSLVDVDCGLRLGDAAGCGGAATAEQIEQIRERLLLNALMAATSTSPLNTA